MVYYLLLAKVAISIHSRILAMIAVHAVIKTYCYCQP